MKKTIKILFTLAFVIAALGITAAATGTNGFYDIGTVDGVTVKAFAGSITTEITAKEANVDMADATREVYYEGSDRIEVTYSLASTGADYGVILVEGTTLPTVSNAIYYINQDEASSQNITFNVYPKTIDETKEMTLFISSSSQGAGLVSLPVSYAVDFEGDPDYEVTALKYGDGVLTLEAADAIASAKILIVKYKDAAEKLLDTVELITVTDVPADTTVTHNVTPGTEDKPVKVIIWADLENCMPLADAIYAK